MENKNNTNAVIIAISVIAIAWITYLYYEEKHKGKAKDKEIDSLERDKLILIKDKIESNEKFSPDFKQQLLKLIQENIHINKTFAKELIFAMSLFEQGEDEKALRELAIICEKQLKTKYKKDNSKECDLDLNKLAVYAKEKEIITMDEFHMLNALREYRNKTVHYYTEPISDEKKQGFICIALMFIAKFSKF
jgi:hypothetical protein